MEKLLDMKPKGFIKYVTPSVLMFLFIALYSVVDGIFVSAFVGTNALASINIVIPLTGILSGVAVMLSSGSSALVAIKMGEGEQSDANQKFSFVCFSALIIGIFFFLISLLCLEDLLRLMGATELLIDDSYTYAIVFMIFAPFALISIVFEYFIRIDGNPTFTLLLYIMGGATNIICDYIFIVLMKLGVLGAALGTCLSFLILTMVGATYFLFFSSTLKFTWPKWKLKFLCTSCFNGISEMVSECASSITTLAANLIMIRLAGENGVAALTIVLYIHFLLISLNLGYITGVSPIISYCYGAKQFSSINKCYNYSKKFLVVSSLGCFAVAQLAAPQFIQIFAQPGTQVYLLALQGLRILGISFLFTGLNIFASGMFTAYGNGKISAIISLSSNLIAILIALLVLPYFLGISGVWAAIPVAEFLTIILTVVIIHHYREQYHYTWGKQR